MTLLQALVYFTREAWQNLFRSWKVSLLAVLTITLSLFLGGVFWLVGDNVRHGLEGWQRDSRVIVYLHEGSSPAALEELRGRLTAGPAVIAADFVPSDAAEERFKRTFPSLEDLLRGWGSSPLPASFELRLDWQRADPRQIEPWMATLAEDPLISMVDDDRDWLEQIEAVVLIFEAAAMVLGAILLITGIFTISSVIRLTTYLYHDEIAVMRLVGATEFFIRGPFYLEGFLQGLCGGILAVLMLFGAHAALVASEAAETMLGSLLLARFLRPEQVLLLVALGGLAGLIGAVASLRRETLGRTAEAPEAEWEEVPSA
jgi:cell division transport system permease protein